MADFTVTNHGTIVLVRPLTEAAEEWLAENVDSGAMWFAGAVAVEPRYVEDLVTGMVGDGLEE